MPAPQPLPWPLCSGFTSPRPRVSEDQKSVPSPHLLATGVKLLSSTPARVSRARRQAEPDLATGHFFAVSDLTSPSQEPVGAPGKSPRFRRGVPGLPGDCTPGAASFLGQSPPTPSGGEGTGSWALTGKRPSCPAIWAHSNHLGFRGNPLAPLGRVARRCEDIQPPFPLLGDLWGALALVRLCVDFWVPDASLVVRRQVESR